ncbi:MAG: LamG domain-containing protein [Candidatus Aenigmatarchaeota archaeon]
MFGLKLFRKRAKGIQVIPTIFYIAIFMIIIFVVGALIATFPGIEQRILNLLRQFFGMPISDIAVIYHFDEGTGSCVEDSSNHENLGRFGNTDDCTKDNVPDSPAWVLDKKKIMVGSGSIVFDHGNDYIITKPSEIGKPMLNMENAEGITIDVWLYLNSYHPDNRYILYRGNSISDCDNGNANFCLVLTSDDKIQFKVKLLYEQGGSGYCSIVSKSSLPFQGFAHVAIKYDNKTNETRVYVQGRHDHTVECPAGRIAPSNPDDAPLIIGCKDGWCAAPVVMDELRIYTRALSPEEIVMHFQAVY